MSVSYHLVPIEKETNSFVNLYESKIKLNNDFSLFAELLMNYSDLFTQYFGKSKSDFDFIFTLNESEISQSNYQPNNLKSLFEEFLNILSSKEDFPIKKFNYFKYEDLIELTFLSVNLSGKELNKITTENTFIESENYEILASFDKWNNYKKIDGEFRQNNTVLSVYDEKRSRTTVNLDLNCFPTQLSINSLGRNISLGKEVSTVDLILKTPFEHLKPLFDNLIAVCDFANEKGYLIKSFISC